MVRKYGTHSPKNSVCAKCGKDIEDGQGRRFRMKWVHENCLPATRLKQIRSFRTPETAAIGAEQERERMYEVATKLKKRYGGGRE